MADLRNAFTLKRVGAFLAVVVSVLTILGAAYTAGEWLFSPAATRSPAIIVREVTPLPDDRGVLIRFTVSNRATAPLFVDRIYFVQEMSPWNGILVWLSAEAKSVTLAVGDVLRRGMQAISERLERIAGEPRRTITKIPEQRGTAFVPDSLERVRQPIFEGERAKLDPQDQVDYRVEIRIPKAKERVRQAIEVEYEWNDGTPRRLRQRVP